MAAGGDPRAAQTDGAFGLVRTVIPPGHSTPLHVHRHEDDAFYVISGTVEFA